MTVSFKRKAASKKQRSGPKVKKHRLVFPNPFRTTAFLNPSGPPLTTKLDMATGVQSVEQAEKQRDMQYMIQRYNAGILNQRERAMKALAEEEKARKTKDLIEKYLKSKGLSKEQINQRYNLQELSKKLTQSQDREDDIPLRFENELGEFKRQLEQKTARYLDSDPSRATLNIHQGDVYPTYFRDLEQMRLQQMIQNEREGSKVEHVIPRLFQGSQSYTNPQDTRMLVNPYSDRYANSQQREVDSQLEKRTPPRQGLVDATPLQTPSATQIETGKVKEEETPLPPELQDVPPEQLVLEPQPAATAAAAEDPPNPTLNQQIAIGEQEFIDAVTEWYNRNKGTKGAFTKGNKKTMLDKLEVQFLKQIRAQYLEFIYEKTGNANPVLTQEQKAIISAIAYKARANALSVLNKLINGEDSEKQAKKVTEEEAQQAADGNSGHGIKPLYQRVKNTVSYGGGVDDIRSIIDLKNAKRERKDKRRKLFRIMHQLEHAGETPSNEKVREAFPDTADTLDVSQFVPSKIPSRKIFKHSFLKQKGYR